MYVSVSTSTMLPLCFSLFNGQQIFAAEQAVNKWRQCIFTVNSKEFCNLSCQEKHFHLSIQKWYQVVDVLLKLVCCTGSWSTLQSSGSIYKRKMFSKNFSQLLMVVLIGALMHRSPYCQIRCPGSLIYSSSREQKCW